MDNKRLFFVSLLLVCMLFCTGPVDRVFAEDSSPKPKSNTIVLSMGIDVMKATLLADKEGKRKSFEDAAQSAAKKQLIAWMWDSIGGYEKIWTGQLDGDAYSKQAKGKILDVMTFLTLLDQVSTDLGAGKYDEAAFKTIDAAVTKLKLPAVTAIWIAVKAAYESHQLLMDSTAAREIQSVYGKVENDTRFFGVRAVNSDQPPLMPETAASADYFFEKYLITDDGTRNLVKTYVKKVLGEEWPEQTWGQWLQGQMAIGSGVDTVRSAEIEKLDTEFRNKARTWIMALLKDVNKQARVRWREMRVTQQLAEFRAFQAEVGHFYNNDLDQMFQEFMDRKARKQKLPEYQAYPAKSAAARAKVDGQVGKLKAKDMKLANNWRDEIENTWVIQGIHCGSGADILGEKALADTIKKEVAAWRLLDDRLYEFVKKNVDNVVREVTEERFSEMNSDRGQGSLPQWVVPVNKHAAGFFDKYFKGLLKPFDWASVDISLLGGRMKNFTPEEVQEAIMAALNEGDFTLAQAIIDGWKVTVGGAIDTYRKKMAEDIGKRQASDPDEVGAAKAQSVAARASYEKSVEPINKEINRLSSLYYGMGENKILYQRAHGAEAYYAEAARLEAAMKALRVQEEALREARASITYPASLVIMGWERTSLLYGPSLEPLAGAAFILHSNALSNLENAYNVFLQLANVRAEQWKRYIDVVADIKAHLPLAPDHAGSDWKPNVVVQADQLETKVKDRSYTFIQPIKGTGSLMILPYDIRNYAGRIQEGIVQLYAERLIQIIDSAVREWDSAVLKLNNLKVPDDESLLQIRVLVDRSVDPREVHKSLEALKGVADKVPGYKDAVSSKRTNLIFQTADTDRANREKDAFWLLKKAKEVENFFGGQLQKKNIRIGHNDYEVNLLPAKNGMVREDNPFPHYMTATELKAVVDRIRNPWQAAPAYEFMRKYAPSQFTLMEQILTLPGIKAAPEENYIGYGAGSPVVWKSALDGAEAILKDLDAKDKDYMQKIAEVEKLLPGIVYPSSEKLVGYTTDDYIYEEKLPSIKHPLAKRYVEIYKMLKSSLDRRLDYLNAKRNAQYQAGTAVTNLRTKLSNAITYLQSTYMDRGDYQAVAGQGPFYEQIKGEYASLGLKDGEIETNLAKLLALVESARIKLKDQPAQENVASERIRELYSRFKSAYESRNDSLVVSYLASNWQSGDGTSISDLQSHLRRTFRVFDEIRYNVLNMQISKQSENQYLVSYDLTILSRIFKQNIKHEEKSSVNEEVIIERSGKVKINRTLGGRFWYVK